MCHLVFLLPVIALPLLWLLPASGGIAAYALVVAVSAAIYLYAFKMMRRPVLVGTETLRHATGTVRFVEEGRALVWVHSELWSVRASQDALKVGDLVEVVRVDGLTLTVRKRGAANAGHRAGAGETMTAGVPEMR